MRFAALHDACKTDIADTPPGSQDALSADGIATSRYVTTVTLRRRCLSQSQHQVILPVRGLCVRFKRVNVAGLTAADESDAKLLPASYYRARPCCDLRAAGNCTTGNKIWTEIVLLSLFAIQRPQWPHVRYAIPLHS